MARPSVYQSEEEKPATVSLRIPRELYEQAQRYVRMRHPMTLTELLLDGLRLRLETPADPRDIILSDDNTVMQELQEMIRAEVQAEIGKLNTFMGSAFDALKLAPAPEALAEPAPALSYNSNTVLQEHAGTMAPTPGPAAEDLGGTSGLAQSGRGRPPTAMRQRILTLLADHPEGLITEQIRAHLSPERPIGDTLQGMRRQRVVRTQGNGRKMRYFVA